MEHCIYMCSVKGTSPAMMTRINLVCGYGVYIHTYKENVSALPHYGAVVPDVSPRFENRKKKKKKEKKGAHASPRPHAHNVTSTTDVFFFQKNIFFKKNAFVSKKNRRRLPIATAACACSNEHYAQGVARAAGGDYSVQ